MNFSMGILVLFVFAMSWSCDGRQLPVENPDMPERNSVRHSITPDLEMSLGEQETDVEAMKIVVRKSDNVCTLCEQFASDALIYLEDNKTRTQFISTLHQSCSQLRAFKTEVNLCQQFTTTSPSPESCAICHRAVDEIVVKLKDPDTQLEILEILLKVCDAAENYAKKCKRLVFEYGPLIITNSEKFLETTDICSSLHACNTSTTVPNQDASLVVLADS